jgi:hypothetical protein
VLQLLVLLLQQQQCSLCISGGGPCSCGCPVRPAGPTKVCRQLTHQG